MTDSTPQINMQMSYGKFPVPITANSNVPPPRKPRNNKKVLAAQPTPAQQQQSLRLMQQPQQLQQLQQFQQVPQQPPQPPPPLQQIDQMQQIPPTQMGPGQMGAAPIGPPQIQQRKPQQMRNIPPNVKVSPPPQQQQKLDRDTFFLLCESLCSFSWMDSVEDDWMGEKENQEVVECMNNADDTETDLDFNSIQDYINVSNNLFRKKQ